MVLKVNVVNGLPRTHDMQEVDGDQNNNVLENNEDVDECFSDQDHDF